MKRLLCYLRDYRKEAICAPIFKILEASFELCIPLVVAAMIDKGIPSGDRGYLLKMCGLMVLLGAVGLCSTLIAQFFAAKAATGFSAKLRHAMMSHIQKLSYTDLDTIGTSTLVTRMTSDVGQVQNGVNLALRLFLRSPFIVFGAMIMAFTVDVKCALVFVALIPALSVVVFGIMLLTMPLYRNVQNQLDTVTDITRENLTGYRVLRAFRKEQSEISRFSEQNRILTAMQNKVGSISALMNPLTYVLVNGAVIVLLYCGAVRVDGGVLSQGQVIALYNYLSQILVELIKLANLLITLTKTAACANRIADMLETGGEEENTAEMPAVSEQGTVVFDHVSLTYQGAGDASLTDISFTAKQGEVIGIIGGTGAGKTSLVNLIPRFYEPTAGSIRIDGIDSKEFPKAALREKIGVVPQRAVLFQGTIRENLLWGNTDADETVLAEALETAQAAEVVASKPLGLDEPISEQGGNLSGGQRQRLTIARALVRKPEILILDDSASALDYATDAALRQALRSLHEQPTVFLVSQRTASIRFADQILVLEDGTLADSGTHKELLARCPIYQEIHYSQFQKEAPHETA
ncbi:MAG: ABC transporter ATP-binding protein/permease [Oscillospiraceae bacterium]|nr:ABC transporter ATP-binding protein/permease [Oscillospiraceae bacterium]